MSREPAHAKLEREFREKIEFGVYKRGDRLPTEAELCTALQLSRHTVRQAYQSLVSAGLIHRVRGQGTFVANVPSGPNHLRTLGSVDDLMAQPDSIAEVLRPPVSIRDAEAASLLEVDGHETAMVLLRRLRGPVPFCTTAAFLDPKVAERVGLAAFLETQRPDTVVGFLDSRLPEPITKVRQWVRAGTCSPDDAVHLQCGLGEPVLHISRLYSDRTGKPIEFARSVFVSDRFTYEIELTRTELRGRASK